MTKRETILAAGKQIAAIASGRALKGNPPSAEEQMGDPSLERQGKPNSDEKEVPRGKHE